MPTMRRARVSKYDVFYRLRITPWERYARAAAVSIAALLDRERQERPGAPGHSLGRALDLGCGRGRYTPELAARGWQASGVDVVPRAIEAARRGSPPGVEYVVGDVTDLAGAGLAGPFDFFLDIGCFQGLSVPQRTAMARGVTSLAAPDATLLMLAFGPTRLRRLVEGVSQAEIQAAYDGWDLISLDDADTAGLGWPMNTTSPKWYRLGRR